MFCVEKTTSDKEGCMRKSVLAGACVLLLAGALSAKQWATSEGSCYAKGDMNLSVGFGVANFGPYALFDYALHDAISIGGGVGFTFGHGYMYLPIVVRGSFHPFNLNFLADKIKIRNKLDPYIGLRSGFDIGLGNKPHFPWVRENVGVRFYPTEKIYLLLEEGSGFGIVAIGVGFKF